MKRKLKGKELELYSSVKSILWKDWDPIGVFEEDSEWDDEYDSYAPTVFSMLIDDQDEYAVSRHLTALKRDNMGLTVEEGNEEDLKTTRLLIRERERIFGN